MRPNLHPINNKGDQENKVKVFGAIGTCLTEPVYMYGDNVQADEFIKFLRLVKSKVKVGYNKPILLYDGAPGHTANKVKKVLNELFTPLLNVPHSSNFNSIETLWSVAKNYYYKLHLANKSEEVDYKGMEARVT